MPYIDIHTPSDDRRQHIQQVGIALSRLKTQMKKANILQEVARRQEFTSRSRKRHLKQVEAGRNRRADEMKNRRRPKTLRDYTNGTGDE